MSIPSDHFDEQDLTTISLLHFKPDIGPLNFRLTIHRYKGPDILSSLPLEILFLICKSLPDSYLSNILRCVSKQFSVLPFRGWWIRDERWAQDRLALVNQAVGLGRFITEDVHVEGLRVITVNAKRLVGFSWRSPRELDAKVTSAVRERCHILRMAVPSQFCCIQSEMLSAHTNRRLVWYPFNFPKFGPRPDGIDQLLPTNWDREHRARQKKIWKYDKKSHRR